MLSLACESVTLARRGWSGHKRNDAAAFNVSGVSLPSQPARTAGRDGGRVWRCCTIGPA